MTRQWLECFIDDAAVAFSDRDRSISCNDCVHCIADGPARCAVSRSSCSTHSWTRSAWWTDQSLERRHSQVLSTSSTDDGPVYHASVELATSFDDNSLFLSVIQQSVLLCIISNTIYCKLRTGCFDAVSSSLHCKMQRPCHRVSEHVQSRSHGNMACT